MNKFFAVLFVVLCSVTACKKEYPIKDLPPSTTLPNFTVPFVSTASTYKFIPFGHTNDAGQVNAGYEVYVTDSATATVLASSSGYIKTVQQNAAGDYKISMEPKRNSIYTIIYNHITNVTRVAGDSVNANTILGKVGTGGRASLQINRTQNGATVALCPDSLASTGFRNAFNLAIQKHNQFNPADSVLSPCSAASLPQ